jgi:hypothetical protein
MHTGRRNQLHLNKLKEFTQWAVRQGYKEEPIKGYYEIMRLRGIDGKLKIFWIHIGGDHVTTDRESQPLVDAWMQSRKGKEE